MSNLNWTFDTVADTYEKLRPGYVDELYQAIFEYKPIDNTSNVVEIGIGGGQATLPILKTGCNFLAVDYGENFCEICRKKFKDYPNFSAVSGKFEDIDFNGEYDLIRNEFFSKIEDAINKHGGEITIYDTIDLQFARK